MAARTKTCVSCSGSLPRGTSVETKEYEDATHHFDKDGDFIYAVRYEDVIHVDKSPAYTAGIHCKACNANAGRVARRDQTYLRDFRSGHVENEN